MQRNFPCSYPLKATAERVTLVLTLVLLVGPVTSVFGAHDHLHLPNRLRVEPDVTLALGISTRGQLPLYISIRDCKIGRTAGYGVKVWVDTVKVFTNETVSRDDYSFSLDLRKLGIGYHYVLTNVCDHHDHVGVSAMWIQITRDLRGIR